MIFQAISIFLLSLMPLLGCGQEISLLFAGDAMQHGPQIKAALQSDGSYDYSPCFKYVEQDIKAADYAVVNLECPLAGKPYGGYPNFSAPDEYALQLKKTGFDLFLTANNHCLDKRDAGLKRTIATLDRFGIQHIGTYTSAATRAGQMPMIIDLNGLKMAMLDYTYGTNGIPIQGNVVVDYINRNRISADIDKAREMGAKAICVNVHWGIEYKLLPVESQRSLAEWLIEEKGVDLIIGGHPHVIEPMEIRHSLRFDKDVLLVYSLGNFISNQNGDDSRGGAMVKVKLNVINGEIASIKAAYKLFFCQKPRFKGENYVLIPADRHDLVRSDSRAAFNLFLKNARRIFKLHNKLVDEETHAAEGDSAANLFSKPYLKLPQAM